MTNAPPKHARGRHAKPPSELTARLDRMIKGALGDPGRRKLVVACAGTASLALLGVAAVAGMTATGSGGSSPRATVAAEHRTSGVKGGATPSAKASADGDADPDEVPEALPYLRQKDPDQKITKHVEDVRRSGTFLRVYTDLKEGDENSRPAVSLCEWTTQFLQAEGDDEPRVFVHGESDDNGSVVLANKQSDKDDCEVGETR